MFIIGHPSWLVYKASYMLTHPLKQCLTVINIVHPRRLDLIREGSRFTNDPCNNCANVKWMWSVTRKYVLLSCGRTWVRFPPWMTFIWKLSSPIFPTMGCKAYSCDIIVTCNFRCLLSQINLFKFIIVIVPLRP